MTDPRARDDEPLLEGLSDIPDDAWDVPEPPEALRELVLARTLGVVRRRRRGRRLALAAAAVVLFSLGAATGRLVGTSPLPIEGPAPIATVTPPIDRPVLPADPRDLVARVETSSPDDRSLMLRQAGDEYLTSAHADPAAALYCYRRLLADSDTHAHRDTDTWLLSYLKLARP